jgi:glycosyltransferase involved in cell wall biosynthesis
MAAPHYIVAHNGAHVWGGAERATALLLAGLQDRGHRVRMFCNDELVARNSAELGVPTTVQRLGGDVAVHDAFHFARVLRKERPDVLIVGTFKKLWLAGLAGRMAMVPRIVARIGLESDLPRNVKYRVTFDRLVDLLVVNAEAIRDAYLAMPEWSDGRVLLIPNGVAVPATTRPPGDLARELGIPVGVPVVGAVGRLATQKRYDRLLQSVAELPEQVRCILAGEGPQRRALETLADKLGITARVHFLGHRADVGDVLASCDVFVLCSDREGMSSAMLEAMAAGVPVVSTPVSGAKEALPEREGRPAAGILIDREARSLTHVLRELLADPHRRQALGAEGARRIRTRYGYTRMIDLWEAFITRDVRAMSLQESGP